MGTEWTGSRPPQPGLVTFVMFESILLAIAGAYLFGSLVRERLAAVHLHAASIEFTLDQGRTPYLINAPLSEDLNAVLNRLG